MTDTHGPYTDLDADDLRARHEQLLRLQKEDLNVGHIEGAKEMARERDLLFKTAQSRGVDL